MSAFGGMADIDRRAARISVCTEGSWPWRWRWWSWWSRRRGLRLRGLSRLKCELAHSDLHGDVRALFFEHCERGGRRYETPAESVSKKSLHCLGERMQKGPEQCPGLIVLSKGR